ncbi:MAG: NfeD family protein, partial [Clostridia bacterium]|nr:NfeD family protein [Clostridia bacterium]
LHWYIHVPAFIVVSLVFMLCFRKMIVEKLSKPEQKTNAETVIGKEFMLLSPIKFNESGTIKVNDVIWNVIAENEETEIAAGKIVVVSGIKGNKYIVKEKE